MNALDKMRLHHYLWHRKESEMTCQVCQSPYEWVRLFEVFEAIESDEFYDMLPGNGEDDRIVEWLRKKMLEAYTQVFPLVLR